MNEKSTGDSGKETPTMEQKTKNKHMVQQGGERNIGRSLFSPRRYLIFFFLVAFVVTVCFLLFLHFMEIPMDQVPRAALVTFGNVMLLSFLASTIDGIRYKYMVEKPVRQILDATQRLTAGDFSVRIASKKESGRRNEFDVIIEDFNKMAEELSGIELLRNDFIAGVSHELKTPLAVIQHYATMLQAPDLQEADRIAYSSVIADTSQNLSALVTNILRLNKLENQKIFPQTAAYNLGEQLRECVLSMEELWENKSLQLNIDIDDFAIEADAELLELVWNNLLSNAIKFTEPGGTVGVKVKEEGPWAVVTISDTGCGMNTETGRHIFEKFYQGDTSHNSHGNGLGLALVKRVIDITNAEISVESTLGVGSIFKVRLPK